MYHNMKGHEYDLHIFLTNMKGIGNPNELKQIMHIGSQLYSSLSQLSRQSFLLLADLPSMLIVLGED